MYSVYNQINKRKVLSYPERVTNVNKKIDTAAYFPEKKGHTKTKVHIEKTEVLDWKSKILDFINKKVSWRLIFKIRFSNTKIGS
jgi:hypothetical protein